MVRGDPRGTFVLTGVPFGETRFGAMPFDVVRPKTFMVNQPLHDGVVLEVEELGTITGVVKRNNDPVVGAAVYLNGPNTRDLDPVLTGLDGRFTARGLRAGSWDVAAGAQKQGAFGISTPDIVQLARGQTAEVSIDMKYAAAISGRVVDQKGAPVPAMNVMFRHTERDDVGLATTAPDGSFRATTMTGVACTGPASAPPTRARPRGLPC